jgi:exopolyphosphatase/guanosine-5'-triphosphate,3'-diphosphate pyrophosphatase
MGTGKTVSASEMTPHDAAGVMAPVGVIDIGSNSVRLVIYEKLARNPILLFNEKVMCGLGRHIAVSGRLDEEGMARALKALERFRAVCAGLRVVHIEAVATAAAREADNADDFIARASEKLGSPIRVLSGEDEARLAAEGVICGLPGADGIVGDLGGGSLEIVEVANHSHARATSLPLGPLRLMDASPGRPEDLRAYLDEILKAVGWLDAGHGRSLYAVGGIWRTFGHIHLGRTGHPINILHDYAITAGEAVELAGFLARQSRRSLTSIPEMSRRRVEAMPYGALVLERLVRLSGVRRVVLSAFGLREGIIFSRLSAARRRTDPLIEFASETGLRKSRSPGHAAELDRWLDGFFGVGEAPADRRLREAAAHMADIAWRQHPDYRASLAYQQMLTAPVAGINHAERAWLALSIFARYGGRTDDPQVAPISALLPSGRADQALALGTAMRIGFTLSGAAVGILPQTRLERRGGDALLSVPPAQQHLFGEEVQKRLAALASLTGLAPRMEVLAG